MPEMAWYAWAALKTCRCGKPAVMKLILRRLSRSGEEQAFHRCGTCKSDGINPSIVMRVE